MVGLADSLSVLSQSVPLKSAAERRAAAQSLALALALDPADTVARDHVSSLTEGKALPQPPAEKLTRALAQIWQIQGWLITAEAGPDGNILGDLIGDSASILDNANPTSIALRKNPEKGKWDNWVAPLSEFDDIAIAKKDPVVEPDPDKPGMNEIPDPENPEIRLTKSTINTVLYQKLKATAPWTTATSPIAMSAEETSSGKFEISIPCADYDQNKVTHRIVRPIAAALTALHGRLPDDGKITILVGPSKRYDFTKNHSNLSGPAFILANAAITGKETYGTVIAELGEKNNLVLPTYFWRLISELPKGEGGRIIVPAEAEPYFTAILTAETPEFFLKNEVLIASTPAEFISLCDKEPSEKHAAVFAKFAEIREKRSSGSIVSYLANRFVRQRLAEISAEAPYHLSAKLLAMQGAGERPRSFPKKILAAEVWRAVDPIHAVTKMDLTSINPAELDAMEKLYDTARAELDRLDRYTEIRDRDLLDKAKSLTSNLRTLNRALRERGDLTSKYTSVKNAFVTMTTADDILRKQLSELSGDPLPESLREGIPNIENK